MKHKKLYISSLILFSSILFSCNSATNLTIDTVNKEERRIEFTNLPSSFKQGDIISLDDIVKIIPGSKESSTQRSDLSYDYEILEDSINSSVASEYTIDKGISVTKAKKIVLLKSGHCVIKVTSLNSTNYLSFDVENDSSLSSISEYVSSIDNYEIYKAYSIDSNYELSKSEKSLQFIKSNNYVYYPSSKYGLFTNSVDNLCYYYLLTNLEDQNSFKLCLNGSYNDLTYKSSFTSTFASLSSFINLDTIEFIPLVNYYYGNEYSYGIVRNSKNTTEFSYLLSSLGLSYSHYINSTRFYTYYVIPKIIDNKLNIYTVSVSSSSKIALEGPYIVENETKYDLSFIDEYTTKNIIGVDKPSSFMDLVSNVKSYSSSVEAKFLNELGEEVEDPSYYSKYLSTFSMNSKFTTTGIESTRFDLIDSGTSKVVKIKEEEINGKKSVYKYEKTSSEFVLVGEYGEDPSDKKEVTSIASSTTFSEYLPAANFKEMNFEYPVYQEIDKNTYQICGLNDSNARSTIKIILKASGYASLVSTYAPLSYYISLASMKVKVETSDSFSGEIDSILFDGSNNTYIYHYEFKIFDINKTTID